MTVASGNEQRCAVTAFVAVWQKTDEHVRSSKSPIRPYWLYRNRFLPP